jgi:hypothetical protein
MHDQRTPAEQDDTTDRAIIDVLVDNPGPWAVAELQREFKNPLAVKDSLSRLVGVGMVHQFEGFVFASRTATRAHAIFEG